MMLLVGAKVFAIGTVIAPAFLAWLPTWIAHEKAGTRAAGAACTQRA